MTPHHSAIVPPLELHRMERAFWLGQVQIWQYRMAKAMVGGTLVEVEQMATQLGNATRRAQRALCEWIRANEEKL